MVMFGDVQTFVSSHSDITSYSIKLLSILSDPVKQRLLLLELAAVIDAGECMVKVTYKLESDGPMVLETYELVNSILESFKMQHVPNVDAISRQLAQTDSGAEQQLKSYGLLSCVKPGYQYLIDTFSSTLKEALQIFKAARLFDPRKVREINLSASSINHLSFLQSSTSVLKNELPVYLAKAEDMSSSFSPLEWWQIHASELTYWSAAARNLTYY